MGSANEELTLDPPNVDGCRVDSVKIACIYTVSFLLYLYMYVWVVANFQYNVLER